VLLHGEKITHVLPGGHERDGIGGAEFVQRFLHEHHQVLVALGGLLAALQEKSVGAGHRQGGYLRQAVRPGLEDHQQHPDGHRDLFQFQVIRQPGPSQNATDVVERVIRDLAQAGAQRLQLRRRERQARQQSLGQALLASLLQIQRVRLENLGLSGLQQACEGVDALGTVFRSQGLQHPAANASWNSIIRERGFYQ